MQKKIIEKFETQLKQRGLIAHGETVFVACSGGPDSTALFHLLYALKKTWHLKLGLLHFNHKLRQAANQDEQFVRKLARQYRVPFFCGTAQVKKIAAEEKFSTEEAARAARYEFLGRVWARRKKGFKIATAHNQDDQAETVLMRVFQGTGLRGLCAIRPILRIGKRVFIRPLLDFPKKEILDYLAENHLPCREDLSNQSVNFLRNRIRLKLIPWLVKEIHPRVVEAAARLPAILYEEAELLESLELKAWERVLLRKESKKIMLSRARFMKMPPPIQFRLLERALRTLDSKSGLSFEAWQKLRLHLARGAFRYSLPKDIDLALTPSRIMLYKKLLGVSS